MKIKLSKMNSNVDGKYNLESIDLEMPQVTFSIKHILCFTMSRIKNVNIKQVVTYRFSPKIMRMALKRFISVLDEATEDGRRNIMMTITADEGNLELIGKRKEMNMIAKLFNEKLNR
jgi:hypothetical protein